MSARDDYPTARFLVQDEPVLDRRFDTAVHREINAMFDEKIATFALVAVVMVLR